MSRSDLGSVARAGRGGWMDTMGLVAAALIVAGPLLGWLRLIPALIAFALFALGGLVSVVVAVAALIRSARGGGFSGLGRTCALVGAMIFVVLVGTRPRGPMINDFTTDTADPPAFENAAKLPANQARNLAYDSSYADLQKGCCADLHPAKLSMPAKEAFALALAVAREMPSWTVVWNDPDSGRIEAVATTTVFGFQDDVAIRVRDSGNQSLVDMRSKSRDGRGDQGTNAKRIRDFVSELEARD